MEDVHVTDLDVETGVLVVPAKVVETEEEATGMGIVVVVVVEDFEVEEVLVDAVKLEESGFVVVEADKVGIGVEVVVVKGKVEVTEEEIELAVEE